MLKNETFDCEKTAINNVYPITFAAVSGFDLGISDATEHRALWADQLIRNGARAISIRGFIEPASVTRKELRVNVKKYRADVEEKFTRGELDDAEQQEVLALMKDTEDVYASTSQPATIVDTTTTVAFDGMIPDVSKMMKGSSVQIKSLANRQHLAWEEMQIASPVIANPLKSDIPAQTLACSAINNLSYSMSDKGALLGFTEHDRQPVYIYPRDAQESDELPILLLAGATRSGKSLLAMLLMSQFSMMKTPKGEYTPSIIIDYKKSSDFSDGILSLGGQVRSLDDIASSDGVLDPIRCMKDKKVAGQFAANIIMDIFNLNESKQVDVMSAINYGIEHGATCTGQAIQIALKASQIDNKNFSVDVSLVKEIIKLQKASNLFKIIFGTNPNAESLSITEGLTLIKSGEISIPSIPESGELNVFQKIGQWVMRMTVFGSFSAGIQRDSVIFLDEAWMFLRGKDTQMLIDEIARLAASQRVFFIMASQRMQEFVEANLMGAVSKGIVLSLPNDPSYAKDGKKTKGQAELALSLFGYEKTDKAVSRLVLSRTREGSNEPNFASVHALRDPITKKNIRGSVPLFFDKNGSAFFTEVRIPSNFLQLISTSSIDVDNRNKKISL
jgi:hypothetical protein